MNSVYEYIVFMSETDQMSQKRRPPPIDVSLLTFY